MASEPLSRRIVAMREIAAGRRRRLVRRNSLLNRENLPGSQGISVGVPGLAAICCIREPEYMNFRDLALIFFHLAREAEGGRPQAHQRHPGEGRDPLFRRTACETVGPGLPHGSSPWAKAHGTTVANAPALCRAVRLQ